MPRFKPAGSLKADRTALKRRWITAFIVVVVLIAAGKIYGAITQRESPVDVVLLRVTSPIAVVLKLIGDGVTYSVEVLTHFPSLLREKNQLRTENEYLSRRIEELQNVRSENEQLKELLQFELPPGFRSLNTSVIARPYDLWLESVIISSGSRDGVDPGNLVVNEKGLAGKVTEVHNSYSIVQLVSSPKCQIWALSGESRAEGMIVGRGTALLALEMVEAGAELMLGEKVFTMGREAPEAVDAVESGLLADQPRGVFIGTIVSREADRNGFLKVTVEPAASPSSLGNIMVMIK